MSRHTVSATWAESYSPIGTSIALFIFNVTLELTPGGIHNCQEWFPGKKNDIDFIICYIHVVFFANLMVSTNSSLDMDEYKSVISNLMKLAFFLSLMLLKDIKLINKSNNIWVRADKSKYIYKCDLSKYPNDLNNKMAHN